MPALIRYLSIALLLCGCDKNPQTDKTQERVQAPKNTVAAASHIGSGHCASCHRAEYEDWRQSHHDLAMQKAAPQSVLGDFDSAQFDYFGTRSTFTKKDGQLQVHTDGPDGKLRDYPVAYSFGTYPLQQYLIQLPRGRLQALSIAWDSRDQSAGGQRWFHLYPEQKVDHKNPLHWTGPGQNWNFMCADCHSTNLQKNYNPTSKTFDTSWSEIDVGCESCHGPASNHLEWAQNPDAQRQSTQWPNKGLTVDYSARKHAAWVMNAKTGIAHLQSPPKSAQAEIEGCARCHARRSTEFPGAGPDSKFLDHFNPALLERDLYYADGQINGEVFVYGSFLQSKMHAAGVTCSNCHEPHSLQLRARGNSLCAQCHLPAKFDTAEHHFHPADSAGAQCINCHMPEKTYMQVDARRDHSFRIPRPDLSETLQTPNTCTSCHTDRAPAWAAAILEKKFGKPKTHYGEAIFAGRNGLPGAETSLLALIADETQPAIARATALTLLPENLSQKSVQTLQAIAQGSEPLLNLGLAQSLESLPPQIRPALAVSLLYDDSRVTAALAAGALAGAPVNNFPQQVQQRFARALGNYLQAQEFNSDRPESLVNLAGLRARMGEYGKAERLYLSAIDLAPYFSPAYINLADLYRVQGHETQVETLLRNGLESLESAADTATIRHALGLSMVRQKNYDEALELLRQSAESPAASARYVYVYAIALNSTGEPERAIAVLEKGLQRFPHDREILQGLVALYRDSGDAVRTGTLSRPK